MDEQFIFDVQTPLGFSVHSTVEYWRVIISIKHPVMRGKEESVKLTLSDPDEIRLSKSDSNVYLFYRIISEKRYLCAVSKRQRDQGFLITAYPTDIIKEGACIWKK